MSERRFEFNDGKSSKFWAISLEGTNHTVRYGKIGTDGQSKTKSFPTEEKARASCDKLIGQKEKKGYLEVSTSAVITASAVREAAEATEPEELDTTKCHLELIEGKTAKFWSISIEGSSHTVTYGRIGTDGHSKTKEFDTPEKAQKSYDKLLTAKLKKGYVKVEEPVRDVAENDAAPKESAPEEPVIEQPTADEPLGTASSSPIPTSNDFRPKVRWGQLKESEVIVGRGGRTKADAGSDEKEIWSQLVTGVHDLLSAEELPDDIAKYLASKAPPKGALDPELHGRLGSLIVETENSDSTFGALQGFWLNRESLSWVLDVLIVKTELYQQPVRLFTPVRRWIATIDQATYDEAVEAGEKIHDAGASERWLARGALVFLFPDHRDWWYTQHNNSCSPGPGREVLLSAASTPREVKLLLALEAKEPSHSSQHFFATLIDRLGLRADTILVQLMSGVPESEAAQREAAEMLCLLESLVIAEFFAGKLSDKFLKHIAADYLRSVPNFAVLALRNNESKAAQALLEEFTVSSASKITFESGDLKVRWDELDLYEVYVGRGGRLSHQNTRDVAKTWEVLQQTNRYQGYSNIKIPQDIFDYLAQEEPPDGPFDAEFHARLGTFFFKTLKSGAFFTWLLALWFTRESASWVLDIIFRRTEIYTEELQWLEPIRRELSGLDDAVYDEAVAFGQELLDNYEPQGKKRNDLRHLKNSLLFFFPTQRSWWKDLFEESAASDSLVYGVSTPEEAKWLLNYQKSWRRKPGERYCGTVIDRIGVEAQRLMIAMTKDLSDSPKEQKAAAEMLALIESPLVAEHFSEHLSHEHVGDIAYEYLRALPPLAIPCLVDKSGDRQTRLLAELGVTATAEVEVETVEAPAIAVHDQTEDSPDGTSVIWESLPWHDVYRSRNTRSPISFLQADDAWGAAFQKQVRSQCRQESTSKAVRDMEEDRLDLQRQSTIYVGGGAAAKGLDELTDFWVAREGLLFALKVYFEKPLAFRTAGLTRLRSHIAAASESDYAAAVQYAEELWAADRRRRALCFLFPDVRGWWKEISPPELWLLTTVDEPKEVSEVLQAVGSLAKGKDKVVVGFLPTLLDKFGVQAANPIIEVITLLKDRTRRKEAVKLLKLILSQEVAEFFASKLNDKNLREIAAAYLKEHPELGIEALKNDGGSAARQILEDLELTATRSNVKAASADQLPEILTNPPWAIKKRPPLDLPEMELPTLDFERRVFWSGQKREKLVTKARTIRKNNREVEYPKLLAASEFERLDPEARLEMWNNLPEDFETRTKIQGWARLLLLSYGLRALPGALKMGAQNLGYLGGSLRFVDSPRVALLQAELVKERYLRDRQFVFEWFRKLPRTAAIGLLPAALDPDHPKREFAREAVLEYIADKEESLEILKEVALEYGKEAQAGVELLLNGGEPEVPGLTMLDYSERVTTGGTEKDAKYHEEKVHTWTRSAEVEIDDHRGPEEALEGWNAGRGYQYDTDTADMRLAEFGVEALPGHLRRAKGRFRAFAWSFSGVSAPEIAPLMLDHYKEKQPHGKFARHWLFKYREATIHALIPIALGPEVPNSDRRANARVVLVLMARQGDSDKIRAKAKCYGAEKEVEKLLGLDLLVLLPKNPPKMPKFWEPEKLPAPLLKSGEALPPEAVQRLGEMLRFSKPFPTYRGIEMAREVCEPESLGTFAWALMQAWIDSGGSAQGYWTLWSLVHLGTEREFRRLAGEIHKWQSGKQKARAGLGLEALGLIGTDEALAHLTRYSVRAASTELRETAKKQLNIVAKQRGFSQEELSDRTAPRLGLDEKGTLTLDLGKRSLTVTFDERLKPKLRDDKGGWVDRFPKAGKDEDKEKVKAASKQWKEIKEDADSVAATQLKRLEQAMCRQRKWTAGNFTDYLVDHPLVRHLSRRLLWATYEDDKVVSTFRVCEDGTLADQNDEEFVLASDATVGLIHPAHTEIPKAWAGIFADYDLLQPFAQFDRPVFRPESGEKERFTRVKGMKVTAGSLFGLCRKDWKLKDQDAILYCALVKKLSKAHVMVTFEPGLHLDVGPRGEDQTLGPLFVWAGDDDLHKLDPVEFSEVVLELESLRGE